MCNTRFEKFTQFYGLYGHVDILWTYMYQGAKIEMMILA